MTTYSIFSTPAEPGPVAVPESFSWFAAWLPPLFALVHGLWWELAGYASGVILIGALALVIGELAAFWLYLLFALWIGFEAPAFRAAALTRRGWRHGGFIVAAAEDLAEAEWLRSAAP